MPRSLMLALLIAVLLAACGAPAPSQQPTAQQGQPIVTIFKAPT
jgi:ABC-type glycerol-3-phosphate transport system substrate-binding protein